MLSILGSVTENGAIREKKVRPQLVQKCLMEIVGEQAWSHTHTLILCDYVRGGQ